MQRPDGIGEPASQTLGVDVSKDKLDVALVAERLPRDPVQIALVGNEHKGFAKLSKWLAARASGPVRVAMEATGSYWQALATQVKREARSWGIRNKTDGVDAAVIARYCVAKRPRAWAPAPAELRELREMVRHLDCSDVQSRQRSS